MKILLLILLSVSGQAASCASAAQPVMRAIPAAIGMASSVALEQAQSEPIIPAAAPQGGASSAFGATLLALTLGIAVAAALQVRRVEARRCPSCKSLHTAAVGALGSYRRCRRCHACGWAWEPDELTPHAP